MSKTKTRIGIIGTGKMATALARGWIQSNWAMPEQILGTDVLEAARDQFTKATVCQTVDSIAELLPQVDVVVLAVKPQHVPGVLGELQTGFEDRHLLVSIAAGVPLATLGQSLGEGKRLVRVMPNTPALVGAGASAFALGGSATAEDGELALEMFSTIGIVCQVPENLLDAVTGLSGSGPAFVYQIIEALSDGGVAAGLPRAIATQLAAQTVLGAARMVLETGEHPAALKDAVASPGGTTIAGLHAMEAGGLRGVLMNAVMAATERSRELGRSS